MSNIAALEANRNHVNGEGARQSIGNRTRNRNHVNGEGARQSIGNRTRNRNFFNLSIHYLNPRNSWETAILEVILVAILLSVVIVVPIEVVHYRDSPSSTNTSPWWHSSSLPSSFSPTPSSLSSSLPSSSSTSSSSTSFSSTSSSLTSSSSPHPLTTQAMPSRSQTPAASTTHRMTQFETSTSIAPTSAAELTPGAPCTNNDQCIAPNICYTSAAASEAFCCGTTVLGCPGASCSVYQDCLDPYGCVTEMGTCCGWGSTTVLQGTTCYTSS